MAKEPQAYNPTENRAYNAVAIPDLVHSALTGTPDNTLADIATADAALEADLKDLAAKINTILAALRDAGIVKP